MDRITVIYNAGDRRKRYKFLYEPLKLLAEKLGPGISVDVFEQSSGLLGMFQAAIESIRIRPEKRCVIYPGVALSGLVWVLGCRLSGKTIILRLAGHQTRVFLLGINEATRSRKYISALVLLINLFVSRIALKMTDGVIVNSEVLKRTLEEEQILKRDCPVFFVAQPVRIKGAEKGFDYVFPKDKDCVTLLTVTNLGYRQKFEPIKVLLNSFLGDSWKGSAARLSRLVFNIVGGGAFLKDLEDYVAEIQDRLDSINMEVNVLGYLENPDKWYESADVFLYGSMLDATPNVLLEAQSYGLPIVVNDLEEIQSVFQEGRNACYYKTCDAENAAKVIADLLSDHDAMREMGGANYMDVRAKFGIEAIMNQMSPVVDYVTSD